MKPIDDAGKERGALKSPGPAIFLVLSKVGKRVTV